MQTRSSSLGLHTQHSWGWLSQQGMLEQGDMIGIYLSQKRKASQWYSTTDTDSIHVANTSYQLGSVLEILYGPAMFPAKLCVLMQMLRIFRGTKKDSVYWAIVLLIWSNFILYVIVTFCFIFACGPRPQLSNPVSLDACMSKKVSYILATSAINIASDFSILLLPVFAVWKLKMALKRKVTISAVFGTGVL